MSGQPPKRSDGWLSPTTIITVLGWLGMVYGSYMGLQKDASNDINSLKVSVAVLTSRIDRLERAK